MSREIGVKWEIKGELFGVRSYRVKDGKEIIRVIVKDDDKRIEHEKKNVAYNYLSRKRKKKWNTRHDMAPRISLN